MYRKLGIILLSILIIITIYANKVQSSQITNCDVSIVGGGTGGLYTAWRLINASSVLPNKVCVFEQTERVGGRLYSLRNAFPMQSSVDIGAHRYNPKVHRITNTIVKKILQLDKICYSRTPNCIEDGDDYYFLRNKYVTNPAKSKNFPYNFLANEKWGPNLNKTFPSDPIEELLDMYPFILNAYEDLTSTDDSIRYPAIKSVLTTFKNTKINGKYPSEIDVRSALNYSPEYWSFLLDTLGEAPYIIEINVYDTLKDYIYALIEDTLGETYKVIADNNGNEIGYATIPEKLAQSLVAKGVRVFYNHQLISILKQNNKPQLIIQKTSTPEDTITVNSDKVILNIPTKSLEKLSRNSVIFTEASNDVEKAYKLFVPVPSGKIYGFYERAWWKLDLDLIDGAMSTTNDLRYFEWSDGVTECNGPNCKGYVLMSYPTGDYMQFFQNPQENKYSAKVIISTNTSFLLEVHRLFVESQANLLEEENINPNTIVPPKVLAMGLWEAAWHYTPVSSFKGGEANAMMLKPLPNMDIYIVNEAYGPTQGWAEASLIMAEKALHLMNVARPNWLINTYWYDAIITNNL